MSEINELAMDLSASIYLKPDTFEGLYARKIESLKNASEFMFDRILKIALSKGYIYEKGEKYYCYKKTVVNVLNKNGYEMDIIKYEPSEFEKQFNKFNKKL